MIDERNPIANPLKLSSSLEEVSKVFDRVHDKIANIASTSKKITNNDQLMFKKILTTSRTKSKQLFTLKLKVILYRLLVSIFINRCLWFVIFLQ